MKNISEYSVQLKIQKKLGGEREVYVPAGNIDLVTYDSVIEVKPIEQWKQAIGQILVYQQYFPDKKAKIALFNRTRKKYFSRSYLQMIHDSCNSLGVEVIMCNVKLGQQS